MSLTATEDQSNVANDGISPGTGGGGDSPGAQKSMHIYIYTYVHVYIYIYSHICMYMYTHIWSLLYIETDSKSHGCRSRYRC